MDGRPNRKNKGAFLNLPGAVWTGINIKQSGETNLPADQSHHFPQIFLEAGEDDWSCWEAVCTSQEEMVADTRAGAATLTGS